MGKEFEINMFEEVIYPKAEHNPSPRRRSVCHTKVAVMKRPCDEMTG